MVFAAVIIAGVYEPSEQVHEELVVVGGERAVDVEDDGLGAARVEVVVVRGAAAVALEDGVDRGAVGRGECRRRRQVVVAAVVGGGAAERLPGAAVVGPEADVLVRQPVGEEP